MMKTMRAQTIDAPPEPRSPLRQALAEAIQQSAAAAAAFEARSASVRCSIASARASRNGLRGSGGASIACARMGFNISDSPFDIRGQFLARPVRQRGDNAS